MSISLSGRPAFGLGLSVLAHVAVLAWLVQSAPPAPAPDAPASRIQVTLLRPMLRLPPQPVAAAPTLPPPAKAIQSPKPAAAASPARPSPAASEEAAAAEPPPIVMLPAKDDSSTASEPAPTQAGAAFDLQAARGAARAFVRAEGAGGGADGRRRPMRASRDEKLGDAIERSRPADCRHAYSGMGVLAVIPLAASAVTGKGCKW
jgi:type IV secretory pathway VirB10-like protein